MFIHHKMNLEQVALELIHTIHEQDQHDDFRHAQSRMKRHLPTASGMAGLHELDTVLTHTAINLLKPEMHAARQLQQDNIPMIDCPGQQDCINPISFGLPCRDTMQLLESQQLPVPRSMIHT
jgi:hypothetical protein